MNDRRRYFWGISLFISTKTFQVHSVISWSFFKAINGLFLSDLLNKQAVRTCYAIATVLLS